MSAEPFSGERPIGHYDIVAPRYSPSNSGTERERRRQAYGYPVDAEDEEVLHVIQPHRWEFPAVSERLTVIEGGLGQAATDGWKCNVVPIRPPTPEDIVA